VEARRSLKEQELFYSKLEGKHAAIDDITKKDYSFISLSMCYSHNRQAQLNFIEAYGNASREISG
jgi:hypothetical protein